MFVCYPTRLKALDSDNLDNFEYFIDFFCERWIPCKASSCVYTSEITFLALHPCPGVISVICNLLLIISLFPSNPPWVGRIIFPSSYLPKYLSNSTACFYNSSNINQWTLYINKINLNKQYSFLICCFHKELFYSIRLQIYREFVLKTQFFNNIFLCTLAGVATNTPIHLSSLN